MAAGSDPGSFEFCISGCSCDYHLYCRKQDHWSDLKNVPKIHGTQRCRYRCQTVCTAIDQIRTISGTDLYYHGTVWNCNHLGSGSAWFCWCGSRSGITGQPFKFCGWCADLIVKTFPCRRLHYRTFRRERGYGNRDLHFLYETAHH